MITTHCVFLFQPLELASPKERAEMLRKRAETMAFFRDMENNIKNRALNEANNRMSQRLLQQRQQSQSYSRGSSEFSRPASVQRYYRTISSMDGKIIFKVSS